MSNFTVENVCIENLFALGGTNVIAVEWHVKLRDRDGKEFEYSGVTVISLKGREAVLVRDYIFDLEVQSRAWGELGKGLAP